MKIKSLVRLPWKLKDVIRAMRHDLADSRRTMAEILQIMSAMERRHKELAQRQEALVQRQEALAQSQEALALGQEAQAQRQEGLELRHEAMHEELRRERQEEQTENLAREKRRLDEVSSMRDLLVAEIREQGLLIEGAARLMPRAAAERALLDQLTPVRNREAGMSILITCWNHAGFLGRAVASAIATLNALPNSGEVLILDDASRDGSREMAQKLAQTDKRIRLIASEDNLGLPRGRNVLLVQARFHHAMILDSDNQLVPSGVAALYVSAQQTGAVLTYGNIVQVDRSGSVIGVISNERISEDLLEENWIDAMALVRSERLLELGGYECQWLYGLEDWELNQRLFSLGEPMAFVPVLVGKYTVSPLSMLREAPTSSRHRRAWRIFGRGDATEAPPYRACIHDPRVGMLWNSPAWSGPAPQAPALTVGRRATSDLKVLVVSSGGVRNYGDDAILLSTLQRLRRIRPDCLATVVSDGASCPPLGRLGVWAGTGDEFGSGLDPDTVRRGCHDNRAAADELANRLNSRAGLRADLKSFDAVLFAGGGNLNLYWPDLMARRAVIAAAANAAGVPYIFSGQGVGPISPEIITMLSFLIGGASAVATRDPASLGLLRRLVPNGPRIDMVGDNALGLRCDGPLMARAHLAEIGVPLDRPLLAFHAREAEYVGFSREQLQNTARQVDDFAAENGYVVVAVPINMQSQGPEVELLAELAHGGRRHAQWHIVNPAGDIAAIAGVIKVCSAVLTHSFHAAVFALESQIPTLLFASTEYYHLKGEALRAAFGIPVPIVAHPEMADGAIAAQLAEISQAPWSRGTTSVDVDAWLDDALPRSGGARNTSIAIFDRTALGIAG